MGKTWRKRRKRSEDNFCQKLDNDASIINLKRWMKQNNWQNETNLQLKDFPNTGRGVFSNKSIKSGTTLISVPYELLITFTTVINSNILQNIEDESLKIQDVLSVFLLTEKQNPNSIWKCYVDSLPAQIPALPWLCTQHELLRFPQDIRIAAEKCLEKFQESYERSNRSIKKTKDCVLDRNLFKWSYTLVNTRGVYVDPGIVTSQTHNFPLILSDPPSMALCPYLDMFNHSFSTETEANIINRPEGYRYELKTLKTFKEYEQIFISYGAHDNLTLLMEYGFFINGNIFDVVKFTFEEIVRVLKVTLDERQYKFVKEHGFIDKLYVGYNGLSFNLKSFLFVVFNSDVKDFNAVIYSDCYSDIFLKNCENYIKCLLENKLKIFQSDYNSVKIVEGKSDNFLLLETFLKHRVEFVNQLLQK